MCVCEEKGQLVVNVANVVNAHSSHLSRSGVPSSSETPPLAEEVAPFQKTQKVLKRKIWPWAQRGSKSRIIVLASASRNLTDRLRFRSREEAPLPNTKLVLERTKILS